MAGSSLEKAQAALAAENNERSVGEENHFES